MKVAAFEMIPTDSIYEKFSDAEGRPVTEQFETIGFEHHLLLNNFGTLGVLFGSLPLFYAFYYCISPCKGIYCCRRTAKKLRRYLFWKSALRLTIECYIIGLICCLINARELEFSDYEDRWTWLNSVLTCIVLPIFCLFPVFILRFFCKHSGKQYESKNVKGRFGELYESYNTNEKFLVLYMEMDYIRKAMLAVCVVIYQQHLWLQMFVLYMSCVAIIIAAGSIKARKKRFDQRMDVFNEVKLIVIMYHMMLFTMFIPDAETKFLIGYSCCGLVVFGTFINMLMLFIAPIVLCKRYLRIKFAKRRMKKTMKDPTKRPNGSAFN